MQEIIILNVWINKTDVGQFRRWTSAAAGVQRQSNICFLFTYL